MSRGALAYFSTSSLDTMDTIRTFSNTYNLPLITWSNFARTFYIEKLVNKTTRFKRNMYIRENQSVRSKRQMNNDDDYDVKMLNDKTYIENFNQISSVESNQLNFRPDLSPVLIELIKFYNWSKIYYIYDNDNGNSN